MRTQLQFLIEIISFVKCPAICKMIYAFLSNQLHGNFDKYLNQKFIRFLKVMNCNNQKEDEENHNESQLYQEVVVEEYDDMNISTFIKDLLPTRETVSKFALSNRRTNRFT